MYVSAAGCSNPVTKATPVTKAAGDDNGCAGSGAGPKRFPNRRAATNAAAATAPQLESPRRLICMHDYRGLRSQANFLFNTSGVFLNSSVAVATTAIAVSPTA